MPSFYLESYYVKQETQKERDKRNLAIAKGKGKRGKYNV